MHPIESLTEFVGNMSTPKLIAQPSKDAKLSVDATLYSEALSRARGSASIYLKMNHNLMQLVAGMQKI